MKKQDGAALIVVLSLLTVSLILGLSSMQSSLIDERLAGNYRAVSQAQMAAEFAASSSLEGKLNAGVFDSEGVIFFAKNPNEIESWADLANIDDTYGGILNNKKSSYRYVEYGAQRYVVAIGRLHEGGNTLAQSMPIIIDFDSPFNFNNALSVFGGIQNINGSPSWYPNSSNAGINGGDDGSSLFYEGDAHACETNADPQACYEDLHLYGGVEYGGEVNNEARDKFKSLFELAEQGEGVIYSDEADADPAINWIGRNESCAENNVYQVAILKTFVAKNNSKFCGMLIVWGGYVSIEEYDTDVTLSGNENVDGTLIAANYADIDGAPDFDKPLGLVDLKINGGGVDGSVHFNMDVVKKSLLSLQLAQEDIDKLFPSEDAVTMFLNSWR